MQAVRRPSPSGGKRSSLSSCAFTIPTTLLAAADEVIERAWRRHHVHLGDRDGERAQKLRGLLPAPIEFDQFESKERSVQDAGILHVRAR
jgi:hypothetical protein